MQKLGCGCKRAEAGAAGEQAGAGSGVLVPGEGLEGGSCFTHGLLWLTTTIQALFFRPALLVQPK